jgi:hypothetical protein
MKKKKSQNQIQLHQQKYLFHIIKTISLKNTQKINFITS